MATEPAQIRHLVDRAVRIARDQRTVTCVIVPNDLARKTPVGDAATGPRHHPLLASATRRRVVVPHRRGPAARRGDPERGRAGRDARRRGRARRRTTRCWQSPTCSAPASPRRCSARPSCPTTCRTCTGSIGLLGTKPSWDLMTELRHAADGRLELPVLGVPARGGPGARRADRPRRRACSGIRYPMESNLVGDAAATLAALLPLLAAQDRPHLARADRGATSPTGGS